ncbi:transglycosylase SLT domain-containing protein [Oryzomonas rubra]|nr:transglycosylase SLT domain-containing protein [Oryzomonas rubra]
MQYIPCGQVEQESEWNPKAHLHTSREDGYGLVQMTVTKNFNIFKSAVTMKPLRKWDWRKDPYNPENQLAFLVLQDKTSWNNVRKWMRDDAEGWKATLVSYNAGLGRVMKRRTYAIAKGIPHDRWTGGLDQAHTPGETTLLYGRPMWKAVNEYPALIFKKAEKYRK